MFKDGKFVARHLKPHDGGELREEQIQPNGVDLSIDCIYRLKNPAVLTDGPYDKPHRVIADQTSVEKVAEELDRVGMAVCGMFEGDTAYKLDPGMYVVLYDEEIIEIPDGHIGFVWPRSRIMRSGSHLTSAVWDTGYSGRGEGGLIVHQKSYLDPNMRIGQMTFVRAQSFGQYDGQHQGERVDE